MKRTALIGDRDRHTMGDLFALVRGYWPEASDEACEHALWNWTSFPFGPDVSKYRRDLETVKATLEAGETPCVTCGKPASDESYMCMSCMEILDEATD